MRPEWRNPEQPGPAATTRLRSLVWLRIAAASRPQHGADSLARRRAGRHLDIHEKTFSRRRLAVCRHQGQWLVSARSRFVFRQNRSQGKHRVVGPDQGEDRETSPRSVRLHGIGGKHPDRRPRSCHVPAGRSTDCLAGLVAADDRGQPLCRGRMGACGPDLGL